jgi:hypothetical protein
MRDNKEDVFCGIGVAGLGIVSFLLAISLKAGGQKGILAWLGFESVATGLPLGLFGWFFVLSSISLIFLGMNFVTPFATEKNSEGKVEVYPGSIDVRYLPLTALSAASVLVAYIFY